MASDLGDMTDSPFRVDIVAQYGGKPPLYTVVIRLADKEPLRRKLSEILNRKFSLGGRLLHLTRKRHKRSYSIGSKDLAKSGPAWRLNNEADRVEYAAAVQGDHLPARVGRQSLQGRFVPASSGGAQELPQALRAQ